MKKVVATILGIILVVILVTVIVYVMVSMTSIKGNLMSGFLSALGAIFGFGAK
jgi:hypothetical protein